MSFWKPLAITLAVLLGLSYIGFAYVYSQGGGIMIAGMITGGMQPKVVTLLRNSNITSSWSTSVNILGYKTSFLYLNVSSVSRKVNEAEFRLTYQFEVDEIRDDVHTFGFISRVSIPIGELHLVGTKMWFALTPEPLDSISAVISMSLYLRD